MSFMEAMDTFAARTENGCLAHASIGERFIDKLVQLDQKLMRDGKEGDIEHALDQALAYPGQKLDPESVAHLFVVFFNARDPRGGKGERKAAFHLFALLSRHYAEVAIGLVPVLAVYGCWQDVLKLYNNSNVDKDVRASMLELYADQLRRDFDALSEAKAGGTAQISLASKWAPREASAHREFAKLLAAKVFEGEEDREARPKYRRMLSALTKHLGVPEVNMCNGTWSQIEPSAVPAACLRTNRKALMNLKVESSKKRKGGEDAEGFEQRSTDPDRVECGRRFKSHLEACSKGSARVHGRTQHPHKLVEPYFPTKRMSAEDPIIEAQWMDMRDRCRNEFGAALGKLVPLVDVSGSMQGIPLLVAVAMGILLSEVGPPEFRNRFLTFESETRWHKLRPEDSLYQKVRSTLAAPWGGSTDFSMAMRMLLDACKQARVPAKEVSELKLVVFSDMQFDAALGEGTHTSWGVRVQAPAATPPSQLWETQYERTVELFRQAGYDQMPRIIFWNLRANTDNFPVRGDTPGVDMVSGFDPNMFKMLMRGELDPSETFRANVLEDPRYERIRDIVLSTMCSSRCE